MNTAAEKFIEIDKDGAGENIRLSVLVAENGALTADGRFLAEAGFRFYISGDAVTMVIPTEAIAVDVATAMTIFYNLVPVGAAVEALEGPFGVDVIADPGFQRHNLAERVVCSTA